MVSHNNALQKPHHRKHWQDRVKTWFDQSAKARRRAAARKVKSLRMGTRPVDMLQPIVQCSGRRYCDKSRAGKGFSLEELQAVKLSPKVALSIGVSVDKRRRNKNEEGMQANIERLKTYMSRLVVFPAKGTKGQKAFAGIPATTTKDAIKDKKIVRKLSEAMPIVRSRKTFATVPM